MKQIFYHLLICMVMLNPDPAKGQQAAIGFWQSHYSYFNANSVCNSGGRDLYVSTDIGIYKFDVLSGKTVPYSKVEGMSDINPVAIDYDLLTESVLIAYRNGNMDVFQDNTFYNINDLKRKAVTGSKTVYEAFCYKGLGYISTDIGVLAINMKKLEVKETYSFASGKNNIVTHAFLATDDSLYVASRKGMFRSNSSALNLQAQSAWEQIDSNKELRHLATRNGRIYASGLDSLYELSGNQLLTKYWVPVTTGGITDITWIEDKLYISYVTAAGGFIHILNSDLAPIDSFRIGSPRQVIQGFNKDIYIADQFGGLAKRVDSNIYHYAPDGPFANETYSLHAENGNLYLAHGAYDEGYNPKSSGFGISFKKNDNWTRYHQYNFPLFSDSVKDFVVVKKNPKDNSIWFGSMQSGIFILKENGDYELRYQGTGLKPVGTSGNFIPANGIAFDEAGNAWINQNRAPNDLVVLTPEGNYQYFNIGAPTGVPGSSTAGVLLDDAGQKWFYAPLSFGGPILMVYNDGGTPLSKDDDLFKFYNSSTIPGGVVTALAKDRDGALWIGTTDGIATLSCPESVFDNPANCQPIRPIVQFDKFAGYLFEGERIRSIAVDGANRKWIGTNNGVWLISENGEKIISRFTTENSPLPSNRIITIGIDAITGDVYFGTESGLVSYKGTATDGGPENKDVLIYPNPVPTDYEGTIGIRGLVENADVRITDITGQLIYRTKALGGQAVWNGKDYNGIKPQTGVCLIFSADKTGNQKLVGKIVYLR